MTREGIDRSDRQAPRFSLGTLVGVGLLSLLIGVVLGSSIGGGGTRTVTAASPRPRPDAVPTQQLGGSVTTPMGNTITVSSFEPEAALSVAPPKHKVFARVEAKWCASVTQATTPVGNLVPLFVLEMPDSTRIAAETKVYTPRDLVAQTGGRVTPGDCVKGWVVFAVPVGHAPAYVDFNGVTTVRWALPAVATSPTSSPAA